MDIFPSAGHDLHRNLVAGYFCRLKIRRHFPEATEGIANDHITACLHSGYCLMLTPSMCLFDFFPIVAAVFFKPLISLVVVRDSKRLGISCLPTAGYSTKDNQARVRCFRDFHLLLVINHHRGFSAVDLVPAGKSGFQQSRNHPIHGFFIFSSDTLNVS